MLTSAVALCVLLAGGAAAVAQSTLAEYPTPVFSNEITGRIAPRDVGDARLTRHFYTFNGTEGDLVVTVESTGLDGSVDLFAAAGLRPLSSVTLYGGSPTRVTRSIYLQGPQAFVLRVEARTPGEEEGSYRVRLEGAFAPASGVPTEAPAVPTLADDERRGSRRVNAAGATIEQPAPPPTETTAAADERSGEPAPERPAPETTTGRTTDETTAAPRTTTARRRAPARTTTRRGRAPARTATTPPAAETAPDETGRADDRTTAEAETPASTSRRRPARRPGRRTARNRPADASPATDPSASAAPPAPVVTATRLVIETKDGERIERDMTLLRRVSVENNQVVITGRDGRVERVPLANVQRMSIEP